MCLLEKKMLFLNISTDFVQILYAKGEKLIFRNQVEYELGPSLVQLFKTYKFSEVLLLNGPGGFTNLRVGALCLNLLKTLEEEGSKSLTIKEITKIDLFNFAVQKGFLPELGAIYIGQKKTLWLYNFNKTSSKISENYNIIKKEELPYTQDNIFFDKVYNEDYFTQDVGNREISFVREHNKVLMKYHQNQLVLDDKLPRKELESVRAHYMVQPV